MKKKYNTSTILLICLCLASSCDGFFFSNGLLSSHEAIIIRQGKKAGRRSIDSSYNHHYHHHHHHHYHSHLNHLYSSSSSNSNDDNTNTSSFISSWVMSYADLAPESESTLPGQLFLATNIAYTAGGFLLQQHGELLLGGLTEIASVASFGYHYGQLATSRVNKETVQLYLLVDYAVAFVTLGTAFVYLVQAAKAGEPATLTAAVASISSYIPIDGLVASFLAVVFLLLSWVWEKGIPYMINHGLWHLLGAYGGYTIGQAHLDQLAAAAVTTAPVTTTMLSI